ncbi:FecR domain-containing protein [Sphingomonas sp. UV9]|uniref:FecR family protein n=1 Tax=Sphingomonas sp. UV9 TaxID=1851410 RepID=UPI001F0C80D8|nr:FecR domain-containing protein [Sphingomonas sp. UV9]
MSFAMPGRRSQRFDSNRAASNRTSAEWIARLNADDATPRDAADFRRWLAANPDHAERFERATDLWDMVPGTAPSRVPVTRRRALAGLVALTATTVGGTVAFQAAYAATPYETGIGEQRRIGLQDGSSLLLDAATRVRVIATPARRRLWLARGRIDLTVAPLATPFTIDAGGGAMTAAAGRFDLRRDPDDRVALTAIQGTAAVTTTGATRRLIGGERLREGRIDRPDLAATQAWTSGRAAFHDDTLKTVAEEANRYSATRLVIADPVAAELRVSGMYRMGDNVALGRSLAALLALRVRTMEGAVLLGG